MARELQNFMYYNNNFFISYYSTPKSMESKSLSTIDDLKKMIMQAYKCKKDLYAKIEELATQEAECEKLGNEDEKKKCHEQKAKLKERLPAVCWHSYFPDGMGHKNQYAQSTGLYMVDYDNRKMNPDQFYKNYIQGREVPLGIVVCHKTPSCKGIRIVAKCQEHLNNLEANAKWLCTQLGLSTKPEDGLDSKSWTKSQLSFLVPKNYWYYIDDNLFNLTNLNYIDYDDKGKNNDESVLCGTENRPCTNGNFSQDRECHSIVASKESDKIPVGEIVEQRMKEYGSTMFKEGERDVETHKLACDLIKADYTPQEVLEAIDSTSDLDPQTKAQKVQSAMNYKDSNISNAYTHSVNELKNKKAIEFIGFDEEEFLSNLELPIGIKESVDSADWHQKMAVLSAIMPICGFYATKLKYWYLGDDEESHLNLMTYIVGESGAGKGKIERTVNEWMEYIRGQKRLGKSVERENKGDSRSGLLKGLLKAEGKHIFGFLAEAEISVSTNNMGGFFDVWSVEKLGFDNSIYRQDYSSKDAVRGAAEVKYNWVRTGTPNVLNTIFKNDKIESGWLARVILSKVYSTDELFDVSRLRKRDFKYRSISKENRQKAIRTAIEALEAVDENYKNDCYDQYVPLLEKVAEWGNKMKRKSFEIDDNVLRELFARSAHIGCRCGIIFHILENIGREMKDFEPVSDNAIYLAIGMAEYVLKNKIDLVGEDSRKAFDLGDKAKHFVKPKSEPVERYPYWERMIAEGISEYRKEELSTITLNAKELKELYIAYQNNPNITSQDFSKKLCNGKKGGYIVEIGKTADGIRQFEVNLSRVRDLSRVNDNINNQIQ